MKDAYTIDTEKLSACKLKDYLRLCVSRNPSLGAAYTTAIWHMSLLCEDSLVVMPTQVSHYKNMLQDPSPNPLQFCGSTFFMPDKSHEKLVANYRECLSNTPGQNSFCIQALEAAESTEFGCRVSKK